MLSIHPTCVIIGSFSNTNEILAEIQRLERLHFNVIMPTREWLDRMDKLMGSCSGDFTDSVKLAYKRVHMETYFRMIRQADFIYVYNQKEGKEYYGLNTSIEIGYAHCLGKAFTSKLPATKPELKHLLAVQI